MATAVVDTVMPKGTVITFWNSFYTNVSIWYFVNEIKAFNHLIFVHLLFRCHREAKN